MLLGKKESLGTHPPTVATQLHAQPNNPGDGRGLFFVLLEQSRSFLLFQWVRVRIRRIPFAHCRQLSLLW